MCRVNNQYRKSFNIFKNILLTLNYDDVSVYK